MVETGYYKDRPRSKTAPQGCPVDHTFSPFEENYRKDSYGELAILEATIALETLVARLPSLTLVEDQTFSFYPIFTFRGPAELWLAWSG